MGHLKAFAFKFVATLVLLYIILGAMNGVDFRNVFLITLVLTVASYLIGDLGILPRTNNTVATIADFGLAFIIIYVMAENLTYGDGMLGEAFTAALGVTLFEIFFHRYLAKNTSDARENHRVHHGNLKYQTEASEELVPVRPDVRNEEDNL
jgi:hypothetical protein